MLLADLQSKGKFRDDSQKTQLNINIEVQNSIYLLVLVFLISFRGARSPLAREPFEVYLNDDRTETKLSIDFSDI